MCACPRQPGVGGLGARERPSNVVVGILGSYGSPLFSSPTAGSSGSPRRSSAEN